MQKSAPLVSIIVPVYNAGVYLNKRIESLLHQTLQEIEIIFVLDCPQDGSDVVVREYAGKDARIKVIANERNEHIGRSRNKGLQAAQGEYVAFADHDDYCANEMYERLYRKAKETQADIVCCDIWFERKGTLPVSKAYFTDGEKNIREKTVEELLKGNGFYYSILNHIYRRAFLLEHDIRFVDTHKVTLEDRHFNLLAYHYAGRVAHIPEGYLHHILYETSTQHSYAFKSLDPMLNHLEIMCIFFREHPEYEAIYRTDFSADVVRKLYNNFLPEVRYKSPVHALRVLGHIREKDGIRQALQGVKEDRRWRKLPFKLQCFYGLLRLFS